MELEEELVQEDPTPTLCEFFASIQHKSKLGSVVLPLPIRARSKRNVSQQGLGEDKKHSVSKVIETKGPKFEEDQNNFKDERYNPHTPIFTTSLSRKNSVFSNEIHSIRPISMSTCKMTRSVSTPEIQLKTASKSVSKSNPFTYRKVQFQHPMTDNHGERDHSVGLLDHDHSSSVNKFGSTSSNKKMIYTPASSHEVTDLLQGISQKKERTKSNSLANLSIVRYDKECGHRTNQKDLSNDVQRSQSLNRKASPNDEVKNKEDLSPLLNLENSKIIKVNGKRYLQCKKLGSGGSSVVYQVMDLSTLQARAIKMVSLEGQDDILKESYKNEIKILNKLQFSQRIIKLYDYEETSIDIRIVMEVGGIDLASLIVNARKNGSAPISAFTIQHYWLEMLLAVQIIHKEGIIHSDLKPANFLFVNGTLKLIDFGIASSIQQDMTSVFKDVQAGTCNYMSPESLSDIYSGPIINGQVNEKAVIKIGVKSDVWSLGCILYSLVYGRTPFYHLTNPLKKLAAISNSSTRIDFPSLADKNLLNVLQTCLQFDPRVRPTIEELIKHPYLSGPITDSTGGR